MNATIRERPGDSVHWYTQDGKPAFDADLRAARKYNLLPSPTSIEALLYNHGIQQHQTNLLLEGAERALFAGWEEGWQKQAFAHAYRKDREIKERGTKIHAEIADIFEKGIAPESPEAKQALNVVEALNPEEVMVEVVLSSPLLGFGCTVDAIVKGSSSVSLLDWKVKGPGEKEIRQFPGHRRQLAAYYTIVNDQLDLDPAIVSNVFLRGSEVKMISMDKDELGEAWKSFEALLRFFETDKSFGGSE